MHNYRDDCRGPPSGYISCNSFISVFVYYTFVIVAGTMVITCTLLPLTQANTWGEDGKETNIPQRKVIEYRGVYRETIRFSVSNSFVSTWCMPSNNATFSDDPSELPSLLRYIEFYGWIGVYVKAPLIAGMLYRCFMILADEREAIYFGRTTNSLLGGMRVLTHILECFSVYLFVGMHHDYDRSLLWLHEPSLSLVILTSAFHMALAAISLFRRKQIVKFVTTALCLFFLLSSFPTVLESNDEWFLEHTCSLKVAPRLAISEYLLFGSLLVFHFSLLPAFIPHLDVALSFYDDHPNYVPDMYKSIYQPVVPHQSF